MSHTPLAALLDTVGLTDVVLVCACALSLAVWMRIRRNRQRARRHMNGATGWKQAVYNPKQYRNRNQAR